MRAPAVTVPNLSGPFGRAAAKGAAVAIGLFICLFVFRLAFFAAIVVLVGVFMTLLVTRRERRVSHLGIRVSGLALAAYGVTMLALYGALTGQHSRRTFEMTWHDNGTANDTGDSEIVFDFVAFPGHSVGVYSTVLRDHLVAKGGTRTEIEFETTAALWCVRGFHEVRIGDLADLRGLKRSGGYYARGSGVGRSPWDSRHWWCREL